MSELDQALIAYLEDDTRQDNYYRQVLETEFFIPIADSGDTPLEERENFTPLIFENEGKSYLMLFDSEDRLFAWAKEHHNYIVISGSGLAKLSVPGLHWAINIGSDFAKEFVPDEIGWLREADQQAD